MPSPGRLCSLTLCSALLALGSAQPALSRQSNSGKEKPQPVGAHVLWRAPDDILARDLFLGPGGEAMRPDLSSVTFVKQETGGYSVKYRVKDGAGRTWVAKMGKEAQSETGTVRSRIRELAGVI